MILSDALITAYSDSELPKPLITPFIPHEVRERPGGGKVLSYGLDSYGYNVRISSKDLKYLPGEAISPGVGDPKLPGGGIHMLPRAPYYNEDGSSYVIIPAKGCLLAHTIEHFNIPNDVFGLVTPKSSYARLFVNAIVTPLQPGWSGQLVLEIVNNSCHPITIWLEEGICQITFFKGSIPDKQYEGVYQNQTGTQEVKI